MQNKRGWVLYRLLLGEIETWMSERKRGCRRVNEQLEGRNSIPTTNWN